MAHILKALEKQDQKFVKESGTSGPLDDHLYMHNMPYSYTAEQIRKLRTFIFHMADRPVPRVIMVTSALPGEGKSLISSNLAIAIAKGEDQQVLLAQVLRRIAGAQRHLNALAATLQTNAVLAQGRQGGPARQGAELHLLTQLSPQLRGHPATNGTHAQHADLHVDCKDSKGISLALD